MTQDSVQSVVFGFGHKARHGKDTAAAAIKTARGNRRPYDIRIYGFAGELKREVNDLVSKFGSMKEFFNVMKDGSLGGKLGLINEVGGMMYLPEWVEYDPKADMTDPLCPLGKQRALLQWWGTNYRRAVNEDYWIIRLAKRLAEEKPEIALVPDLRFLNEMAFCKQYGETLKVVRPHQGDVNSHPSETALAHLQDDAWSAVIVNDGTLEELKAKAVQTFDRLMEERP